MDPAIIGDDELVKKASKMFIDWVQAPLGGECSLDMPNYEYLVANNTLGLCRISGEYFYRDKTRQSPLVRAAQCVDELSEGVGYRKSRLKLTKYL